MGKSNFSKCITYQRQNVGKLLTHQAMKYLPKSKSLEFSSDAEAAGFHDQLTELMRVAMSTVGDDQTSDAEASKLTMEFFERYAALTDALCRLRAHMHRKEED